MSKRCALGLRHGVKSEELANRGGIEPGSQGDCGKVGVGAVVAATHAGIAPVGQGAAVTGQFKTTLNLKSP